VGIRYQVPGWPAQVRGHSAVTPHFTRLAGSGAMQYKDGVTGRPGTAGIPVKPVIPSPDVGDKAQAGISRSGDAPNEFYPNQYWARPERAYWPGAGMPVSVGSDNLMPVPATDPRGVGAIMAEALGIARSLGITQIKAYPMLAVWPDVNT
jgi:hypothetical protein